jgi:hypothetical protein
LVATVLLFSTTFCFIRMRQISHRSFSRKMKRSLPEPLISLFVMFVVNWLLPKKVEFVEDYSLFVVQKENHTHISKNFNIG